MPPAARITDMHVCPKVEPGPVPHVGGPVSSGETTVLIGFMPAARVGDSAVCIGPPDSVSQGEPTVIIGNKAAARLGDPTSHGGVIVAGCPTVIIGSSTQANTIIVAAQNGTPFCEECAKKAALAAQPPPQEPAKPVASQAISASNSPKLQAPVPQPPSALLPGEGQIGTYKDLRKKGKRGDNLTPHHIPSDAYMKAKVPGYTTDKGLCIMMEHPHPGQGGRHRKTSSFGVSPDLEPSCRQVLAREIRDARKIYQAEGLYTPEIQSSLRTLIAQNKTAWPGIFDK